MNSEQQGDVRIFSHSFRLYVKSFLLNKFGESVQVKDGNPDAKHLQTRLTMSQDAKAKNVVSKFLQKYLEQHLNS